VGLFDGWRKKLKDTDVEERGIVNYGGTYHNGAIFSTFNVATPVSEDQALKIPSVVACVELITGSIAQLPVYLYKENDKGEVERVPNDRRIYLLNNEPNTLLNGYNLKKRIAKDYLFYGVSYIKKETARNNVIELNPLDMKYVQVTRYLQDGYKWDADIVLTTYGNNGKQKQRIFKPIELMMVLKDSEDGVSSEGVLQSGTDILGLALNEIEYTSNILKNGALPIGVIETVNRLSEKAITRLRAGWESLYSGSKNSGKTVILEEGLEYKPISIKPNDMQLVDGRKVTISEIARLFNIPESMINADANKYASNEQNNLYFLQYTLSPIIAAIESALDKSLLLETEKEEGYYFRFDTTEILRTTEKERAEAAGIALKAGYVSLNETRAKFDMHKLDDDYFMWSLGNILYNPKTHDMFVPNMQGSADLDEGPVNMNQQGSGPNMKPLPAKNAPQQKPQNNDKAKGQSKPSASNNKS
jgi:HK97 family phage portal protein